MWYNVVSDYAKASSDRCPLTLFMKRSELLFNLISIVTDWAMLFAAGIAAFYLRFELEDFRPILYTLSLSEYLHVLLAISPIILLLLAVAGLYNLKGNRRFTPELLRILLAVSSGLLVVVILFFFNQTVFPSRLIILLTWALTIVFLSLGRIILRMIQVSMLRRGIGLHNLVVISDETKAHFLVSEIKERKELGYNVVGNIPSKTEIPELLARLEELRQASRLDELLQSDPNLSQDKSMAILKFCRDYGIKYNFVTNLFETSTLNTEVETISGVPIIVLKGTPLDGWGRVVKRIMDVGISATALVITSPIMLATAIIIKMTSKGPVFFHQARAAGLGEFEFYKFRSMYSEMSEGSAEGDKLREELEKQNARKGPFVKIKNDPRVTPVGRFIRRTKIDELPQLWHILVGKMSLIGPRVHMVKEVNHFRDDYKQLFIIKPGATGLTQILQATEKPEISWEEEIKLDEYYIENWSISMDISIIFKTILILLGRKPKVDY
jgi:exopolysaccharide biosynthesis polyprenyl glycosylphosphotransferase